MINCYQKPDSEHGICIKIDGDVIQITTEFVCIASMMLHDGIPFESLMESLFIAANNQGEWESE